MPRCDACSFSAKDRLTLGTHVRTTHTPVATFGSKKIIRQADKLFHCPSCDFSTPDPLKILTHHKRKHSDSSRDENGDLSQHVGDARDFSPDVDGNGDPPSDAQEDGPPTPSPPIQHPSSSSRSKKRKMPRQIEDADEGDESPPITTPASVGDPTSPPASPINVLPTNNPPSDPSADVNLLHKISFTVDPVHKIAICLDCECAVPAMHVRAHVVKHSLKPPPSDELDAALRSLGCLNQFTPPQQVIPPIIGLKIWPGSSCEVQGCYYLAVKDKTMQEHFQFTHPNKQWRPNTHPRQLQRIFEFRGRQSLVMVDITLLPSANTDYDRYMAKVTKHRPVVDSDLYHVNDDTRSHGTFLAKMRWNQAIEGLPLPQLLKAASLPGDDEPHFKILHTAVHTWLEAICKLLPNLDLTFLRWINTPKGDIVNAPFRAPVTNSYVAKCARIWSRLLMMFLRSLETPQTSPFQLLVSEAQANSLEELLSSIRGVGRGRISDIIQRASFLFMATSNDHITQDRFSCSLIRYLIVSHLLTDGTFELPSNIVPNMSCIQFCMRATGVQAAYNHAVDSDDPAEGLLSYYQTHLKEVLTEGHRYPFTTLREEMHLLSAMAHSETRLPSLLWNEDHTVLQVDGSPFIVASLREMIRAQLAGANQMLDALCEGLDMTAFDACLNKHLDPKNAAHWPRDPLRKQTLGYSFLTDADNPFVNFQFDLMKKIVETPDIFDKYHVVNSQGDILFKQASIGRWFSQLSDFHDLVFSLVHVTSGGPARGTELETYRLINTRESPRTLYFVSGHLAFITGYNKSRQLSNFPERFVARPVYPPIQRLIMYLAGPLHHIADVWIGTLNHKTPVVGSEVFNHFGKPLRSEDFSRILHAQTAQHLLVPMGLRVWRQMIKALMRHVVNVDIDDDGDQEEDALDESFGHTTSTGRSRYGLTWNDLPHLHEDMLNEIFRVSQRFWDWLERPAGSPRPPLQPDISYSQIHAEMAATLAKLQLAANQQTDTIELSTTNQTLILEMLRSTNQKIDRNHRAVIEGCGVVSPSPVQHLEPIDIAFNRTQALKSYLGQSDATFRSVQQASAVEVISRGLPHLLVVMPTGSGKSAIYASPGYLERKGFRVVILTYRSLFDQAVQDARTRGIPYSIYPSHEVDLFNSRLVFVTLEHAARPDFRTWCIANKQAGLLRCIVMDEVHDAILAAYYRHAFNQLFKLTDLGVQVLLMTATLSPLSEETLLQVLGMEPASVRKIRMPTHRPEIQYRVVRSSKESIDTDVLSAAASHNLEQHERGIIFVLTTTCCDDLAETSGFPKYHGKLTDAERTKFMWQWRSGKSQWIIGTLAMAQGIDIRHVRVVINREISWVSKDDGGDRSSIQTKTLALIHFAQMSGRAGRDGKPSTHFLFYSCIPAVTVRPSDDHEGQQAMVDFVTLDSCRRSTLSSFLDGVDQTCTSILNAQLCDICLSHAHTLKIDQQFYSSPLGRRLKAPPPVEPTTPAMLKSKFMGLPTPITSHTSVHESNAIPSSPTPFRQNASDLHFGSDQAPPSSDDERRLQYRTIIRSRKALAPPDRHRKQKAPAPPADESSSEEPERPPPKDRRSAIRKQKAPAPPADESSSEEPERPPSKRARFVPFTPVPSSASVFAKPTSSTSSRVSAIIPATTPARHAAGSRASSSSTKKGDHRPRDVTIRSLPMPALGEGLPTSRDGKCKQLLQWCEMYHRKCSVCLFYGEDVEHFAYNCPKGVLRSSEYRNSYKTMLRFKSLRILCFGCLLPYDVHVDLPTPRPNNPFSCMYDDHIRPIAYLVYTNKAIRSLVFEILDLRKNQFISIQAFTSWCSAEEPNNDALPNVLEIIIAYMNLKSMGALPNVTFGQ